MGLSTPIDRHYRFGELFSIRGTYSKMIESENMKMLEKCFYDNMMKHIVESGNMEKIERFSGKNRKLSNFAIENSLNEAYEVAESDTSKLNIPRVVKQSAAKKARMAVNQKSLAIKTNSYRCPSFTKLEKEPTIYESLEDYENTDDSEDIDKIIKDVAEKKGILGNSIPNEESPSSQETDIREKIKHNYSIQSIIIEAFAGNQKKTQLIPPTYVFEEKVNNEKNVLNSTIKGVTDSINSSCGINFTEKDYIWLASGRPVPHFKGEIAVNSDIVKGNRVLNMYFGPTGTYKDYLYKADGTPRVEMSKASEMDDVDIDVNSITAYPIIKVYATVISWDNVNGKDVIREITEDDFYGTEIKYVK